MAEDGVREAVEKVADQDLGKAICFFQSGAKFKSRYATFGFQQAANLDSGDLWPTSYALNRLTPDIEEEIGRLVKKAAS